MKKQIKTNWFKVIIALCAIAYVAQPYINNSRYQLKIDGYRLYDSKTGDLYERSEVKYEFKDGEYCNKWELITRLPSKLAQ
jgi:hypothetical protein